MQAKKSGQSAPTHERGLHSPVSMQTSPAAQVTPTQLGSTQLPCEHRKPNGQDTPAQLSGRHWPTAQRVPAGQTTPTHADGTHESPWQTVPAGQPAEHSTPGVKPESCSAGRHAPTESQP